MADDPRIAAVRTAQRLMLSPEDFLDEIDDLDPLRLALLRQDVVARLAAAKTPGGITRILASLAEESHD